jgi:ATP-dependent Zn protease
MIKYRLKYKFFALTLLPVMVLNIFKYQIPRVEYSIFKDYIAKNLCIKKDVKNNCCEGKCFLKKQIKEVDENSSENSNSNNNSNNKKIQNDESKEFLGSYFFTFNPVALDLGPQAYWESSKMPGFASAIFVPPKYLLLY